ncbi:MAG: DUF4868 domain-containing protein [Lachnospiraceae bacterium]|nr:DUF4868 domain-containing protein [Lachnospiraceae bacterium]
MSINLIEHIFEGLHTCNAWSLQILKINNSKRNGTSYFAREIELNPPERLYDFVCEIADFYCKEKDGRLKSFLEIRDYDGSALDRTIYKLEKNNQMIEEELRTLFEAISDPDHETNPLEMRSQAYLLKGVITVGGEEHAVKLISMQNPVSTLKHKFWMANGTFTEITDKVISLRTTIDIVIYDNTVYMMTLAGEKLFNMERAYKNVCNEKLNEIDKYDIVNDFKSFGDLAGSGHNPRKFVAFNDGHLKKLKKPSDRKKIAKKFGIPLDGDKFDMSKEGSADKLVKVLCDRGMVDPFDDNPMEVAGSKKWQ